MAAKRQRAAWVRLREPALGARPKPWARTVRISLIRQIRLHTEEVTGSNPVSPTRNNHSEREPSGSRVPLFSFQLWSGSERPCRRRLAGRRRRSPGSSSGPCPSAAVRRESAYSRRSGVWRTSAGGRRRRWAAADVRQVAPAELLGQAVRWSVSRCLR
jgi:hypothetical protein